MAEETAMDYTSEENIDRQMEIDFESPADVINLIYGCQTSSNRLVEFLTSLRNTLKTKSSSWVVTFGQKGLNGLQFILEKHYYKTDIDVNRGEKIHYECIKCLRELIDKADGLQLIIANKKILQELCESLDYKFPVIMISALDLLSIMCFFGNGQKHILQILTEINGDKDNSQRFTFIVDGLTLNNDILAVSCFKFVNAIINSSFNNLDLRLHLRNEFMRAGLTDILKNMENGMLKYKSKELEFQVQIFHQYREQDCDKIFQRFDNLRFQLEDVGECFANIKGSIIGTDCEPLLLSILQHLLFIRDDPKIRVAYYRLIEECISQIVIHHSGCDPDFRTSKKVAIYVHPEIAKLPKIEEENWENASKEFSQKMEEIILTRQLFEDRIAQLETELHKYRDNSSEQNSREHLFNEAQNGSTEIQQLQIKDSLTKRLSSLKLKERGKSLEPHPSFLHSIRPTKNGANIVKKREMEDKIRKAKEAAELREKEKKKREEKKNSLKKMDKAARQAQVERSLARRLSQSDGKSSVGATSRNSDLVTVDSSNPKGPFEQAGKVKQRRWH